MQSVRRIGSLALLAWIGVADSGCGSVKEESVAQIRQPLATLLWASPTGSGASCTQTSPCSLAQAQSSVRAINANMTKKVR